MKALALMLCLFCGQSAMAQSDGEAIKATVISAYIEGIHNRGDVEAIRKGFHPTFTMLRMSRNEIKLLPIEEWIAAIEKAKLESQGRRH